MAEDDTVRQHHQFNGKEFERTPGDSGEWGSLACYTVHGVTKNQTGFND